MNKQNPELEQSTNYEAIYDRPVVDATIEGIEFSNPEDARTRAVLGREVAPGISFAMEVDEDGLPRPNPFGGGAVRSVNLRGGNLQVGQADYGSAGQAFKIMGTRAGKEFTGIAAPSFGYYDEQTGSFTCASDATSMESVDKSIEMATQLYEVTEGKPFEPRKLGADVTLDGVRQLALGIANRDYMHVNSRYSARHLASLSATASITAFSGLGAFETRPESLDTPFMQEVKDAIYDQDVWKNLQNANIQQPDLYISDINETIGKRNINGYVGTVLEAVIKDDVKDILATHKEDIDAQEQQERDAHEARVAATQERIKRIKDEHARETLQRFDALLPEPAEAEAPQQSRRGLRRKLAAVALTVTTALGLGTVAHEALDDTPRPTKKIERSIPEFEQKQPKQSLPETQPDVNIIENEADTVTVNEQTGTVDVALKQGGNPSFAARDAYIAEGVEQPTKQQIYESVTSLQMSDADARSMQPGATISFTTQKAADGTVKLIAKK